MNKKTGSLIASAVAGLFVAGTALTLPAAQAHEVDGGYCKAPNSCKGKGDCGVKGKHDCGGKNSCSGHGWVKLSISKADCGKLKDASWEVKKEEKPAQK